MSSPANPLPRLSFRLARFGALWEAASPEPMPHQERKSDQASRIYWLRNRFNGEMVDHKAIAESIIQGQGRNCIPSIGIDATPGTEKRPGQSHILAQEPV